MSGDGGAGPSVIGGRGPFEPAARSAGTAVRPGGIGRGSGPAGGVLLVRQDGLPASLPRLRPSPCRCGVRPRCRVAAAGRAAAGAPGAGDPARNGRSSCSRDVCHWAPPRSKPLTGAWSADVVGRSCRTSGPVLPEPRGRPEAHPVSGSRQDLTCGEWWYEVCVRLPPCPDRADRPRGDALDLIALLVARLGRARHLVVLALPDQSGAHGEDVGEQGPEASMHPRSRAPWSATSRRARRSSRPTRAPARRGGDGLPLQGPRGSEVPAGRRLAQVLGSGAWSRGVRPAPVRAPVRLRPRYGTRGGARGGQCLAGRHARGGCGRQPCPGGAEPPHADLRICDEQSQASSNALLRSSILCPRGVSTITSTPSVGGVSCRCRDREAGDP